MRRQRSPHSLARRVIFRLFKNGFACLVKTILEDCQRVSTLTLFHRFADNVDRQFRSHLTGPVTAYSIRDNGKKPTESEFALLMI